MARYSTEGQKIMKEAKALLKWEDLSVWDIFPDGTKTRFEEVKGWGTVFKLSRPKVKLGDQVKKMAQQSMEDSFWLYVCRIEAYRRFGGIPPKYGLYSHPSHFTAASALHYTGVTLEEAVRTYIDDDGQLRLIVAKKKVME